MSAHRKLRISHAVVGHHVEQHKTMKAISRVTRKTEYASIVEMPQEKYYQLQAALESGDRVERKNAEKTLNGMIGTKDWQDDDLLDIEEFKPFKDEDGK